MKNSMKNKLFFISLCLTAQFLSSCSEDLGWMKGTWQNSNGSIGLAINPNNGFGAVRTILLEDKWLQGKIKLSGDKIIFTYNNTDVQLEFTFDRQEQRIYAGSNRRDLMTKLSEEFLPNNHY